MALTKSTFSRILKSYRKTHNSWGTVDKIIYKKVASGHLPEICLQWYKEYHDKQTKEFLKVRRPLPVGMPRTVANRTPAQHLIMRQRRLFTQNDASRRYYIKTAQFTRKAKRANKKPIFHR